MRILQQARLQQARIEMLRAGQSESLARIAAEHGFSNPTRFAQSFLAQIRRLPVGDAARTARRPVRIAGLPGICPQGSRGQVGLPARPGLIPNECVFPFPRFAFRSAGPGADGLAVSEPRQLGLGIPSLS
jgi:hypothetical protein